MEQNGRKCPQTKAEVQTPEAAPMRATDRTRLHPIATDPRCGARLRPMRYAGVSPPTFASARSTPSRSGIR
jgi:hypothetical protein